VNNTANSHLCHPAAKSFIDCVAAEVASCSDRTKSGERRLTGGSAQLRYCMEHRPSYISAQFQTSVRDCGEHLFGDVAVPRITTVTKTKMTTEQYEPNVTYNRFKPERLSIAIRLASSQKPIRNSRFSVAHGMPHA
jgi:hypothetical protein